MIVYQACHIEARVQYHSSSAKEYTVSLLNFTPAPCLSLMTLSFASRIRPRTTRHTCMMPHPTPRKSTSVDISTKYWNINLPRHLWTEQCPEYLRGQGTKNIEILSTRDEDFQRLSWPEVKELVGGYSITTSPAGPPRRCRGLGRMGCHGQSAVAESSLTVF